jgi:SAM-dependent methyltransferase
MQYEPLKRLLGKFFSGSLFLRRLYYFCLDMLLLRAWHIRRAMIRIRKIIPSDANVLDAGSGPGQYIWRMARINKGWNITGVDIDERNISECGEFFRKAGISDRVTLVTSNLETYIEPDSFYLVLSVDVMEHIKNDDAVFNNFFRSMKPGGILLISTPSDKGGSDVSADKEESFIGEHVRPGYSIREITEKLKKAGFTDVVSHYTYGKPGNISWQLTMKYPVKMLNISYLFFILLPIYYLISFPFSIILNIFDLCLTHKAGTGLLVTAKKAR